MTFPDDLQHWTAPCRMLWPLLTLEEVIILETSPRRSKLRIVHFTGLFSQSLKRAIPPWFLPISDPLLRYSSSFLRLHLSISSHVFQFPNKNNFLWATILSTFFFLSFFRGVTEDSRNLTAARHCQLDVSTFTLAADHCYHHWNSTFFFFFVE